MSFRELVMADWRISWNWVMALTVALALDVLLGLVVAFKEQKLNSTISRAGIARKVGVMIGLGLTGVLDPFTPNVDVPVLGTMTLTASAAAFWLSTEGLSLTEKLAKLGVPLPKPLVEALVKVRGDIEPEPQTHEDPPAS